MLGFADMMRKQIVMPAHMMNDLEHGPRNQDRNLFADFSAVTEKLGGEPGRAPGRGRLPLPRLAAGWAGWLAGWLRALSLLPACCSEVGPGLTCSMSGTRNPWPAEWQAMCRGLASPLSRTRHSDSKLAAPPLQSTTPRTTARSSSTSSTGGRSRTARSPARPQRRR